MYYKGHKVRVAVTKYEETGYAQALMINEENNVVEELTINPINIVSDSQSNLEDYKPKFAIIKEEFLNLLNLRDFISNYGEKFKILLGTEELQVNQVNY